MVDSLAKYVVQLEAQTEKYQQGLERATSRLESFHRKQTSLLEEGTRSFERFSRNAEKLLRGAGAIGLFTALIERAGSLAEKFKSVDPEAERLNRSLEQIKSTIERGLLSAFEKLNPYVENLADLTDPSALATKRLADATRELADAEKALAAARAADARQGTGFSITRFFGGETTSATEARRNEARAKLVAAQATVANLRAQQQAANNAFDPSGGVLFKGFDATLEKQRQDAETAAQRQFQLANAAKQHFLDNIDDESKALEKQDEDRQRAAQKQFELDNDAKARFLELVDEEDKALQKQAEERQKMVDAQAEAFSDLFTQNLVQAADGGFKAVLKSWALTIEQMILKAEAANLFKTLFPAGFTASAGGVVGGIAKFLGFRAGGGPVSAGGAYMVGENGPEIFTPSVSGSIIPNGGVTITQNISVGGGASRAEVLAAMKVATNAAKAELANDRRRGR